MSIIYNPIAADTWDSVYNLLGSQGQAIALPTDFFPAAQRLEPLRSEIAQPAVSLGVPRLTAPDAPSLAQTAAWASANWMTSPYEAQYAPAPESPQPSFWDRVFSPIERTVTGLAAGAEEAFWEANEQLPDLLLRRIGLLPEAQVVNTQGDIEYHIYQTPSMAPATIPGVIQEQPRGLFNMGFGDQLPARTVPIPRPATAALVASPILMIVGLYLLFSR